MLSLSCHSFDIIHRNDKKAIAKCVPAFRAMVNIDNIYAKSQMHFGLTSVNYMSCLFFPLPFLSATETRLKPSHRICSVNSCCAHNSREFSILRSCWQDANAKNWVSECESGLMQNCNDVPSRYLFAITIHISCADPSKHAKLYHISGCIVATNNIVIANVFRVKSIWLVQITA